MLEENCPLPFLAKPISKQFLKSVVYEGITYCLFLPTASSSAQELCVKPTYTQPGLDKIFILESRSTAPLVTQINTIKPFWHILVYKQACSLFMPPFDSSLKVQRTREANYSRLAIPMATASSRFIEKTKWLAEGTTIVTRCCCYAEIF